MGGGNNKMQLHDKITPKSRPYSMRRRGLTHSGTLRLKQQQQQQQKLNAGGGGGGGGVEEGRRGKGG